MLLCALLFAISAYVSTPLVFSSGPPGGTYDRFATHLEEAFQKTYGSGKLEIVGSEGSIGNLKRLYSGEADFAVVQSNDLFYFAQETRSYPMFKKRIRAIARLNPETIHIVVRADLKISEIEDLAGRRVNLGPKNSGTYYNAQAILSVADVLDKIKPEEAQLDEAAELLKKGEVDAAFFTFSSGSGGYLDALQFGDSRFEILSLPFAFLKLVNSEYPSLSVVHISPGTYKNIDKAVFTLGVHSVLVCRSDIDPPIVEAVTKSIFESPGMLDAVPGGEADAANAVADLPIPYHPGALAYYGRLSVWNRYRNDLQIIPFAIAALALIFLHKTTYSPTRRKKTYTHLLRALTALCIIWIVGALFMYAFEQSVNKNFGTVSESFWSIATYLLSGFEDRFPITSMGKIISIFIIAVGVSAVAFITADIASMLTHDRLKGERNMKGHKDHIVICNWNSRGEKIVNELHHPSAPTRNTPICILTSADYNPSTISEESLKKVIFIKGDPTSRIALQKTGCTAAKAIIVLAGDGQHDPDGNVAQVLLAIKGLIGDREKSSKRYVPRLVAENYDHRNWHLLSDAGSEEIVCGEDFAVGIIAQCAIYPGMSKIYNELMTYSVGGDLGNEFYFVEWKEIPGDLQSELCSMAFEDAARYLLSARESDNPPLLVGIKRKGKIILNPREREHVRERKTHHIEENDTLIFISYLQPRLRNPKGGQKATHSSHSQTYIHDKNLDCEDKSNDITNAKEDDSHVIICNWNQTGEKIVEELHHPCSPMKDARIIVLSESTVDDKIYSKNPAFRESVVFLSGDTTNKKVLEEIAAHEAKSIIVLSSEKAKDADGRNTLTILALNRLFAAHSLKENERPDLIVEAQNHRKIDVMLAAGTDEIICKDDYSLSILAQGAIFENIAGVYYELLDYNKDNNEIYLISWDSLPSGMQKELIGLTFEQLAEFFLTNRNPKNPVLVVGVARQGEFILNPIRASRKKDNRFDAFKKGDSIIAFAYEHPEFVDYLKIKTI